MKYGNMLISFWHHLDLGVLKKGIFVLEKHFFYLLVESRYLNLEYYNYIHKTTQNVLSFIAPKHNYASLFSPLWNEETWLVSAFFGILNRLVLYLRSLHIYIFRGYPVFKHHFSRFFCSKVLKLRKRTDEHDQSKF